MEKFIIIGGMVISAFWGYKKGLKQKDIKSILSGLPPALFMALITVVINFGNILNNAGSFWIVSLPIKFTIYVAFNSIAALAATYLGININMSRNTNPPKKLTQ